MVARRKMIDRRLTKAMQKKFHYDVEEVIIKSSEDGKATDFLKEKFDAWKKVYQGQETLLILYIHAHGGKTMSLTAG
jgi:hypothetical protein